MSDVVWEWAHLLLLCKEYVPFADAPCCVSPFAEQDTERLVSRPYSSSVFKSYLDGIPFSCAFLKLGGITDQRHLGETRLAQRRTSCTVGSH